MNRIVHLLMFVMPWTACSSEPPGPDPIPGGYLAYDSDQCVGCDRGVLTSCQFGRAATSVAIVSIPDVRGSSLADELHCPHDASPTLRIEFEPVRQVHGPSITEATKLAGRAGVGQRLIAAVQVGDYHYVTASIAVELRDSEPSINPEVQLPPKFDDLKDHLADLAERFDEVCPGTTVPVAEDLYDEVYDSCVAGEAIDYTDTHCDELIDHLVFECNLAPIEAVTQAEACVELVPGPGVPFGGTNNTPNVATSPLDEQLSDVLVECLIAQPCEVIPDVGACDPRIVGPCEEWVRIYSSCGSSQFHAEQTAADQCRPATSGMTDAEREEFFACIESLGCDELISNYWEERCVD